MSDKKLNYTNLIISPHLDDAVFSLGGLIAEEPQNTKVVTIFAGTPKKPLIRGWDLRCGFINSTKAMKERLQENILALKMLELDGENIINLPLLDKQYRNSILGGKKENIDETKISIINEFKKIIDIKNLNNVKIFIPMCENNTDHKIVKEAFLEFYKNGIAVDKNISLYLYQDMPYFYSNYYKGKEIKSPKETGIKREIIEISEENFIKKIKASSLYKSQFAFFSKINSLLNKTKILSEKQKELLKIESSFCEIIYEVMR